MGKTWKALHIKHTIEKSGKLTIWIYSQGGWVLDITVIYSQKVFHIFGEFPLNWKFFSERGIFRAKPLVTELKFAPLRLCLSFCLCHGKSSLWLCMGQLAPKAPYCVQWFHMGVPTLRLYDVRPDGYKAQFLRYLDKNFMEGVFQYYLEVLFLVFEKNFKKEKKFQKNP